MSVDKFPLKKPTWEDAQSSFYQLQHMPATDLMKFDEWVTRYDYKHPFLDMYIDNNISMSTVSNHYHFDARMCCDSINSPSPIRSWLNPKIRKSVDSCKMAKGNGKVALALRKYIASQFRPSAAKCLYDYFGAKRVFDPCMGWGDRLAGFMASDAQVYHGLDVNPHLFLNYERQVRDQLPADKAVEYVFERAETFEGSETYDFIFTSPPYFDVERYDGLWSSHNKYKKLDAWLEKFLFKMLDNAWDMLEVGGHLCINISDVYAHHTVNKICDPMVDYMLEKDDLVFNGAFGYRMGKRPNSKAKDGIFCEPVWWFTKVSEDETEGL